MEYWADKARDLDRNLLEAVGKSAESAGTITAVLLGLVSVAAFAGGIKSIDDLPEWEGPWLKAATLVAGLGLAVATIMFHLIAGGPRLKNLQPISGPDLKDLYEEQALDRYPRLKVARWIGFISAGIVVLGTAIILIQSPNSTSVAVVVNGRVVCGDIGVFDLGRATVDSPRPAGDSP